MGVSLFEGTRVPPKQTYPNRTGGGGFSMSSVVPGKTTMGRRSTPFFRGGGGMGGFGGGAVIFVRWTRRYHGKDESMRTR